MNSIDLVCVFTMVMEAHTVRNTREEYRRFDGKTPFFIHPIGMATIILNDPFVPWETRLVAALAAAAHDVLEDTSLTEDQIYERVGKTQIMIQAVELVKTLTFESSAASQAHFEANWQNASLEEVLVRAADICDNIITFKPEGQRKKLGYLNLLHDCIIERLGRECALTHRIASIRVNIK